MNSLRSFRIPGAISLSAILLTGFAFAQARPSNQQSPYGGTTVEEIIARVDDQIITRSDYDRAQSELDQEMRQHGSSMQEISDAHKDLLRNLIDQQLWLAKGKQLGITGETELVNRLNDLRKQYNLATMEDLEKAAKEQGVSFEDFKANIRNQIITQEVMRDQVGRKIAPTPGEIQRYFEAHKQQYAQPESIKLSEILISTGTNPDDPQKLAEAKAKADDIESRLHNGADFAQIAKSFSEGSTAAEGGDLGQFKRGQLDKVFEDKTFPLKAGEYTDPIRTKQGYVILKVVRHIPGGVPQFKDVENDVEQNYFEEKAGPAMRQYLAQLRDEAFIQIKPGYSDSAATPAEIHSSITFSAYTPPSSKKKRKVERTRFRETAHSFRQKSRQAPPLEQVSATTTKNDNGKSNKKKNAKSDEASMKPGKKEKIRFGKAPQATLPATPASQTEDAGAGDVASNAAAEPDNPLEENSKPEKKTRFSDRAKLPKQPKPKGPQLDPETPAAPDAAEVADRQAQAGPLGLGGNQTPDKKKKKKATTTGDKTRLSDQKKKPDEKENTGDRPLGYAPQQPQAQAPNGTTPAPPQSGLPTTSPQ